MTFLAEDYIWPNMRMLSCPRILPENRILRLLEAPACHLLRLLCFCSLLKMSSKEGLFSTIECYIRFHNLLTFARN